MLTNEQLIGKVRSQCESPNAHQLRSAVKPFFAIDLKTTIAYLAVSGGGMYNDDIGYVVTVLYLLGHHSVEQPYGNKTFPNLLAELYHTGSDTTKKDILIFLESKIDEQGLFWKRLFGFARRIQDKLESLDCIALANDLTKWNENNSVRIEWAKTITKL